MALTNDLISQFVKATKDTEQKKTESTVYGTAKIQNGVTYVQIDGSDILTPAVTTASTKDGERVTVLIKDHTAIITGNVSSPSARVDDIEDMTDVANKITELEILMADTVNVDQLNAEAARIDALITSDVLIKNQLSAAEGDINNLQTNVLEVTSKMTATEAEVKKLGTEKLDADKADITYATIENLNATNADVHNLNATYAEFARTTTDKLEANTAIVKNLDANYANIDFSNIGKAAMEYFYAASGLIKDVVVGDATITGKLVGVTISGALLEGETVVADKLVIKGNDGLYYKLNTDGVTTSAEQTDYNSLNGKILKAHSVTAEKITVEDLVAFDATIGGLNISEGSIYSVAKTSATNDTEGLYIGADGQFAVGDTSNFLKYYKDQNGKFVLAISSKEITEAGKTATNFMEYGSNGLQIGDKTGGSWAGFRTQITNKAFNILNTAGSVLASYGEKLIELGKNATDAVISFCGGKGQIEYDSDARYLQLTGDQVRVKGDTMSSLYSKYYDGTNTARASSVNVTPDRVDVFSQESIDIDPDTQTGTWKTSEMSLTPDGLTAVVDNVDMVSRGDMNFQTVGEGSIMFNGETLLDLFYPIGSIYMSTVYFDPGTKFGGKWERLMDRFLLGTGSVYVNGQTGGEATHTLTTLEMPKHQHIVGYQNSGVYVTLNSGSGTNNYNIPWTANAGYASGDLVALEAGGGYAHNNMPPYLAVNIWKRVE